MKSEIANQRLLFGISDRKPYFKLVISNLIVVSDIEPFLKIEIA